MRANSTPCSSPLQAANSSLDGGSSLVRSCSRSDVRPKVKVMAQTPPAASVVTMEQQMEAEIQNLRREISEVNNALDETYVQMELQRTRTRQFMLGWKARIHEADELLRREKLERDLQIKEQTSQALFLEDQIKKEKKELEDELERQTTKIKEQLEEIKKLEANNKALRSSYENLTLLLPEPYWHDISIPSDGDVTDESVSVFEAGPDVLPTRRHVTVQRHGSTSSQTKSVTFCLNNKPVASGFRRSLSLPNCHAPRRKPILKTPPPKVPAINDIRRAKSSLEGAESLPDLTDVARHRSVPSRKTPNHFVPLGVGRTRRRERMTSPAPRGATSLVNLASFDERDYHNALVVDSFRPITRIAAGRGGHPRRKAAHQFYIADSSTPSPPPPPSSSSSSSISSSPANQSRDNRFIRSSQESLRRDKNLVKPRESTRDKLKRIFTFGRDSKRDWRSSSASLTSNVSSQSTMSSHSTGSVASSARTSQGTSPVRRVFTAPVLY